MTFLADLKDEIIILNLQIARDSPLTNRFFGKITGRVRVIPSETGEAATTWIGDFAFNADSKAYYDADKDEYSLRVSMASDWTEYR